MVGEQPVDERPHLRRRPHPDVDVDPEDHHLPSPPLGPVDEGGVARAVGDLLVLPAGRRVRPTAVEVDAERVGGSAHVGQAVGEVGRGLGGVGAHPGHQLDRVGQQLLGHHPATGPLAGVALGVGLLGQLEQLLGARHEVEGDRIDQTQLPLHPEGSGLRRREGQRLDEGRDLLRSGALGHGRHAVSLVLSVQVGRVVRRPAQAAATSVSRPVATSKTKPRTESLTGMNGLAEIRESDWRTSSSRSLNASAAHAGLIPVSSWIDALEARRR